MALAILFGSQSNWAGMEKFESQVKFIVYYKMPFIKVVQLNDMFLSTQMTRMRLPWNGFVADEQRMKMLNQTKKVRKGNANFIANLLATFKNRFVDFSTHI